MNLSALLSGILGGWACVWTVGYAFSWPTWWAWSAVAFFLASSLGFARAFFSAPCTDSDVS